MRSPFLSDIIAAGRRRCLERFSEVPPPYCVSGERQQPRPLTTARMTGLSRNLCYLPKHFQSKLNLPRGGGGARNQTCCGRLHRGRRSRRQHMSDEIRSIEIGAVQEVEDLQPELKVLAFMQACIFQDGQVPRCKVWANQRISPRIAVESAVVWR